MHKLIEFICDELDDLERKAEKGGKLTMTEVQYMDTLAHAKKNLLKSEEMMDGGYSMDGYSRNRYYSRDGGYSEARGRGRYAKRDSMGRYSRDRYSRDRYPRDGYSMDDYGMDDGYSMEGDFQSELEQLMNDAPNDQIKQKLQSIANEM